jgi:anionic cell wall polymer biosynthesis LytR-Cps2A-Psr (LCP) family protein/uncharacterized protein YraI
VTIVILVFVALFSVPIPAVPRADAAQPPLASHGPEALPAASPSASPVADVQLPPGTINIALLGVDKRPGKTFNNTDVIVLASINPDIPSVTLLSIPRDWPAYIPGVGVQKVNTAYEIGGAKLFYQTIQHNFGLKLDYYALVNFEGLVKAVDTLGGVDAIATCRLYHVFPKDPYYMGDTQYVRTPYKDTFTGEVWKVGQRVPTQTIDIPTPGVYTLNGMQALAFVRARKGVPGGDVDRGRREQRIVRALFAKAKQINAIPKFPELFAQFKQYISTDIPLDKLLYFASLASRFDDTMIRSRFMDPGGANGAAVQLADNATEAGTQGAYQSMVQDMLSVALNQRPNDGIPIEVWNGTNDPGFGSAAVDRLNELGFNVVDIKAADKLYDHSTVVDFTTTRKGSAIPLLQRTFGLSSKYIVAQPSKDGPRYRVIIGPDFKTCYYDDTYVLALRGSGDISDDSLQSTEPATPTIALTPEAPLTSTTDLTPTVAVTSSTDVSSTNVSSTTQGVIASVPLGDQVNVRTGPGVPYPTIGMLDEEQTAPVNGKSDDGQWLQISFKSGFGWIATGYVRVTGDPASIPIVAAPPLPKPMVTARIIARVSLNIRTGPGVNYSLAGRMRAGQAATIIGRSADGRWWQIRYGNVVGWVAAAYVRQTGDVSNTQVTN